jgi:K+-transporting ATPase KdpF subunit
MGAFEVIASAAIAAAVLTYLLYALIRPEHF